jgi:hypothetical protein
MSASELKPCPFPHEVARGVFVELDDEEWDCVCVRCGDCAALGPVIDLQDHPNHEAATNAAIAAWNTRQAADMLSTLEGVRQWQPIESAEKTAERTVLLARFVGSPYGWVLGAGHYNPSMGSFEGEPLDTLHRGFAFDRATHWMPLPEPPAALSPMKEIQKMGQEWDNAGENVRG